MMTIEEIYNENDISIRAYNICKYNGLDTIDKLLGYYLINYSFKNLRNCGARSNEELIGICEKYKNSIHNNIKEIDEESIEKICKNLTEEQENIINSFILIEVENLSVRTRNALLIFFNDIISISNIVDRFFLDIDFKTFKINNIGEKSALELEIFISKIRNFIYNIVEERDEKKIILLKNKLLVKSNFHINQIPAKIGRASCRERV